MADLTKSSAVRDGSAAITSNNGAASQTIVFDGQDEKIILRVSNADATTARININAGDGIRSVLGALKVDVAQNAVKVIGPLDSMRFKSLATGKITATITGTNDAAFGGTITNVKIEVIQLP